MFTRFNSRLPARPESIAVVLKVLSQNDELMVKDIARLGRLTQSQARMALEELVTSGTVVARKVQRPRKTLYYMNQSQNSLLENSCQGNHEAGDSQKSDVGLGVPVIPGDQSPPVV